MTHDYAATQAQPRLDGPSPDRRLVVVTGGSGLLGSHLIKRLVVDHDVVSLDLDGDPRSPSTVEFVCTDITDAASTSRAFSRLDELYPGRRASLVHLAAYHDFSGEPSPRYEEVTIEGTRRILDMVGASNLDIDQFVFTSTMLVHAATEPGEEIDESDPIEPSWPYPDSKIATESMIRAHPSTADRSTAIVRIAGVYDEDGHSPPITNQIKRIDGRWPTSHFYPADRASGQAFVHIDDAVDALARILERRATLPRWFPVLIGEPETIGYAQLQNLIGNELYGRDWTTIRIPAPIAKLGAWAREKSPFGEEPFIRPWMIDQASDHYDLDISAAEEHLGWHPRHSVADTIPEMLRRLADDREGWYATNGIEPPRRLLPA